MSKYPESEKLLACADAGAVLADFVDFLREEKRMYICKMPAMPDHEVGHRDQEYFNNYQPVHDNRYNRLFAELFGVDLDLVEKERNQMLEDIRKATLRAS